jgi:glucose-1-phosphate cytidylyltransferase
MKCVIFCGGKGTRLREETEFKPKPLVEIGGKPIIWHIMKIYSQAGVKDFILTLGYKGDSIKRYFTEYKWRNYDFSLNLRSNEVQAFKDDNEVEDWNITFADTGLESGTALRLWQVRKYLENEEDFCVTYGDGVANIDINDLINYHKSHMKIATLTGIHLLSRFGQIVIDGGNCVTEFKEKPDLCDLINGGFMVLNRRVFNYMSDENCMMEPTLLPKLTKAGQLVVYRLDRFWHCMDTIRDVDELNDLWAKSKPWKVW